MLLGSVSDMDAMTRRRALAAGAALTLGACSDAGQDEAPAVDESPLYSAEALAEIAAWEEENRVEAAWLKENRATLPIDYDGLAELPWRHRRTAANALPPATQAALMAEHLRRSVASRPDMNEEQRAVIAQVQELLTHSWYFEDGDARQRVWERELLKRSTDAFSGPEWHRIFGTLGLKCDESRAR